MIDWDRIAQLRDEVGPEVFPEVVELFLDEVDEVTRRLATAPEPGTLAHDLHFLKGSALNLGFARFGALCGEGERLAASGRLAEVSLGEILECYRTSRQTFVEAVR